MSDDMSASPSSDHLGLTNEESIYQNYTASEVLVQVNMCINSLAGVDCELLQGLAGVVSQADVELMVRAQKKMLQRFEKTNENTGNQRKD